MGIIIDFIIIAVILLSTFLAYKKGLISLAVQLCSFIIAIIVTAILYQPISNLVINSTSIDETIENAIYEKANDMMQENQSSNEVTNQITEAVKNEMLPETARTIAVNIVTGGVMILLLIAINIALRLIKGIANQIAKLPILKQFNEIGGMIYGILRGILIVYVVLLILVIPGQIQPDNRVNQSIEQSYLGKVMYENNILNVFFS